jgi:hypothetical protein
MRESAYGTKRDAGSATMVVKTYPAPPELPIAPEFPPPPPQAPPGAGKPLLRGTPFVPPDGAGDGCDYLLSRFQLRVPTVTPGDPSGACQNILFLGTIYNGSPPTNTSIGRG